MSDIARFFAQILNDLEIEASDEFDRNFERKAFFDESWPETKHHNSNGSLMMRSGNLRKSINSTIDQDSISWTSNLPYASIHNEGGEITVTQKMKKFFWARYMELKETTDAAKWKAMALLPVGHRIKIEQRQYIGDHPEVKRMVEDVVDENMKELEQQLFNGFTR